MWQCRQQHSRDVGCCSDLAGSSGLPIAAFWLTLELSLKEERAAAACWGRTGMSSVCMCALRGCAGAVVAEAVSTALGAAVPPCHHAPCSKCSWRLVRAWLQLGQGLLEEWGRWAALLLGSAKRAPSPQELRRAGSISGTLQNSW